MMKQPTDQLMWHVCTCSIGRLVELAIKNRTGGQLKTLETSLLKDDIQ